MKAAASRGQHSLLAGIGILLSPECARDLASIAAQVRAGADADFIIGAAAPPHVTLLHAHCAPGDELTWWQRCAGRVAAQFHAEILELATSHIPAGDYHSPRGGTYIGLNLVRDEAMEAAHLAVLQAATEAGAVPRGAFGARYHPHITLAVLHSPPTAAREVSVRISGMPVTGCLALAAVGAHGKFAQILQPAG